MKIITVNLLKPQIKALAVLVDAGMYPSRSEAIRVAIRDFLKNEEKTLEILNNIPDEKGELKHRIKKVKIKSVDMRRGELSDEQIELINHNLEVELEKIRKEGKHIVRT